MTGPQVIIGCGKTKQPVAAPAIDLYTGAFTRRQVAWARSVTSDDRIIVFSAKHGLIAADTVIEPYDVTFNAPRSQHVVTDATLAAQADALDLTGTIITLAGAAYRRRLLRASGGRVQPVHPFVEQCRSTGRPGGIGTLMTLMASQAGSIPDHPAVDTALTGRR